MDDKTQHPFIEKIKRRAGGSMADAVTDESIAADMLRYGPDARAEILLEWENEVAADDNTDLRKKAQLMTVARTIRNLDLTMRKAGR